MTLSFKAASLGVLAALGLAAAANAQAPANPDPAAVQPGAYAVEPEHTQVVFRVSHLGFTTYFGEFSGASGSLVLDPRDPAADRLEVTIPMASVHTTSAKLDEELRGGEWFDAARFPTATFRSTRVSPTGANSADVEGMLTLHGVTRPAVLHARFNGAGVNPLDKGYTAGFEVSGHIKRSEFGVSKYVPLVGDDVELIISGAFEKKPS